MTRDETKALIMSVNAFFPNFKVKDPTAMVNAWHMVLCGVDSESAKGALLAYATTDTSGFAPSVGQIFQGALKHRERDLAAIVEGEKLLHARKSIGRQKLGKIESKESEE